MAAAPVGFVPPAFGGAPGAIVLAVVLLVATAMPVGMRPPMAAERTIPRLEPADKLGIREIQATAQAPAGSVRGDSLDGGRFCSQVDGVVEIAIKRHV